MIKDIYECLENEKPFLVHKNYKLSIKDAYTLYYFIKQYNLEVNFMAKQPLGRSEENHILFPNNTCNNYGLLFLIMILHPADQYRQENHQVTGTHTYHDIMITRNCSISFFDYNVRFIDGQLDDIYRYAKKYNIFNNSIEHIFKIQTIPLDLEYGDGVAYFEAKLGNNSKSARKI